MVVEKTGIVTDRRVGQGQRDFHASTAQQLSNIVIIKESEESGDKSAVLSD